MPIAPAHVALVRRFAPILYFHPGERYFPSDAKRYLEHCALWRAQAPFDDKNSWGGIGSPFPRSPLVAAGSLAGLAGEVGPGGTFLGQPPGTVFPLPSPGNDEERFLELGGWEKTPPGSAPVDTATTNRFANLIGFTGVEEKYDLVPALKGSRFWYHAETFDAVRLREFLPRAGVSAFEVAGLLATFKEPFLVCYYLFFPGHIEGIDGCQYQTDIGWKFANSAGGWACVALLLDRPAPDQEFKPRFIGLTSRNVGQAPILDQDGRVAMTVEDWSLATAIDDHVRLFVAAGSHGLYLTPGVRPIQPFTADDLGWRSCGVTESLDEVLRESESEGIPPLVMAGKLVVALGTLGLGALWIIDEIPPFGTGPFAGAQEDHPPEAGDYGTVVHPQGVVVFDAGGADEVVPWSVPSDPAAPDKHEATIDGRAYSFMVDRRETDPKKQQVWWPSDGTHDGYTGRWGPRVANDPRGRRAGMRFPDFVRMFVESLAKKLST